MKLLITASAAFLGYATLALANPVAPTDVHFDEYGAVSESLSGAAGDAENGAVIMTDRGLGNCVACHEVSALSAAPFHGEVGPSLDGVAERWNQAELRGIVANAKMTYDGTIMPAFYKTTGFVRPGDLYTGKAAPADLAPILSAQEIEDVVAFLMTLQ